MSRRLLIVANVDWFFLSHRLPIAHGAVSAGYNVHVACGDSGRCSEIEAYGLTVHRLQLQRGRAGVFSNIRSFAEILKLFWRLKPRLVHLVTIKPILFGGVAARLAGVPGVVAAVSGLGFVFIGEGLVARGRRWLVGLAYRLALGKRNLKVIFQNPDDRDLLCLIARVPMSKVVMIRGSGIQTSAYADSPLPRGTPVVMLAARLLRDKGVMEFIEAAKLLADRGYDARFCLVGDIDPDNPTSLTADELTQLPSEAGVEYWGHSNDMPSTLSRATVVVLPSYREGLPRVLLEAAASGRAVVTTNVPGCRDAIEPGVTGLLVPPRDGVALSEAIGCLLRDLALAKSMGSAGRRLAQAEFDISLVVQRHMEIYAELEAVST
jgi:glycosyltransferase involved in cell wall biosynthesis